MGVCNPSLLSEAVPGDDEDNDPLYETDSSSSEGGRSASASATDHGGTSTDATSIIDPNTNDENTTHSIEVVNELATGNQNKTLLGVGDHLAKSPRRDPELEIGDGDGGELCGTEPDGTTTAAPRYPMAVVMCATEYGECAALQVGWRNEILRWMQGAILHYRYRTSTFTTEFVASKVESALVEAISCWEGVGVSFKQVKEDEPATFEVVFDPYLGPRCYADSFFPQTSLGILRIGPLSFDDGNDEYLTGILAHELGHILGLRHEKAHTRETDMPSVCFGGENPGSIMDFDGDLSKLRVNEKDVAGLREMYAYDEPTYQGMPIVYIDPVLHPSTVYGNTRNLSVHAAES